MKVFYKNYKRDDRTLLSIQSVKHLFPELEIYCLLLFDEDKCEYDYVLDKFLELNVKVFFDKKTYNFGSTSAVGSKYNGYYFTEGVNKMYNICLENNINGKVLMLDEDHFFTTGKTIKHLLENNFDLAVGYWGSPGKNKPPFEPNASIICVNVERLTNIFPIPEMEEYVEILWGWELVDKLHKDGGVIYKIPTRNQGNFFGDGVHTNDINVIKKELENKNIPYKL